MQDSQNFNKKAVGSLIRVEKPGYLESVPVSVCERLPRSRKLRHRRRSPICLAYSTEHPLASVSILLPGLLL